MTRSFAVAVGAFALAGCVPTKEQPTMPEADTADSGAASTSPSATAESLRVAFYRSDGGAMPLASDSGSFVSQDGCLRIIVGEKSLVPVFPTGTPVSANETMVRYGERTIPMGETVTIGGGERNPVAGAFEIDEDTLARCTGPYMQVASLD